MKKTANYILCIALFMLIGAIGTFTADFTASKSSNEKIQTKLAQCTNVADLVFTGDYAQRALRISDCMAAQGFLFTGSKPSSICYAENIIQVQIKHILPSCYEREHLLSRLLQF